MDKWPNKEERYINTPVLVFSNLAILTLKTHGFPSLLYNKFGTINNILNNF